MIAFIPRRSDSCVRCTRPIRKALKNSGDKKKWLTAELIGSLGFGAKAAVPALRELLEYQNAMVREAALEAMEKTEQWKPEESQPRKHGDDR
jgi:hypothetical protein